MKLQACCSFSWPLWYFPSIGEGSSVNSSPPAFPGSPDTCSHTWAAPERMPGGGKVRCSEERLVRKYRAHHLPTSNQTLGRREPTSVGQKGCWDWLPQSLSIHVLASWFYGTPYRCHVCQLVRLARLVGNRICLPSYALRWWHRIMARFYLLYKLYHYHHLAASQPILVEDRRELEAIVAYPQGLTLRVTN